MMARFRAAVRAVRLAFAIAVAWVTPPRCAICDAEISDREIPICDRCHERYVRR
jgi:hypothetical protein